MLVILNDTLFEAQLTPVMPGEYHVEYNAEEHRMELFHNRQKVEYGVTWYSFAAKIDPRTGKIEQIKSKFPTFRALFGGKAIDFTLRV